MEFHQKPSKWVNLCKPLIWISFIGHLAAGQAQAADVMLGAYVSGDGWNTSNIESLNTSSDNKLTFINLFTTFSYTWERQLQYQANNIYNQGLVPLISFMPVDNTRKSTSILQEIIDGEWDAYLTQWAQGLKKWVDSKTLLEKDGAIMLRFAHEFNATWYSYGNQPDKLVKAWQHVYTLFEGENVNNYIQWIWCANNVDVDDVRDVTQYYPGNDYVDWTSIDGYNWGSNYSFSRWKTFSDTFANLYRTLVDNYPEKPILLAELGTTEPNDTPRSEWGQDGNNTDLTNSKETWFQDMLQTLPETFPAIRAISLFNINKELGWSINGSTPQSVENSGLTAWREGIADTTYTTDYLLSPRFSVSSASLATESTPQTTEMNTVFAQLDLEQSTTRRLPHSPVTSAHASHWPWLNPYWKRYWCCHWFPQLCIETQPISEADQIALANGPKPEPVPVAEEKLESTGLRYANCQNKGLFGMMKNRAETSGPELSSDTSEFEQTSHPHLPDSDSLQDYLYHYCTN